MAINFTTPNSFSPNDVILSADVNENFQNVETVFDGIEAGTTTFAQIKMDANPSAALNVATKQYVDNYAAWRRPNLTWISVTQVDVENNTGTANQTSVLFPDGELRTVTENTSSTNIYRRFDITATANFTSGTEDSGLYSGLSETTNTWYAIYAVKSQINSSNFVLVGTTTLPLQANFSTLNSNLGSNSWVYLGLIRNGDNSGATGNILDFVQSGNQTLFENSNSGAIDALCGTTLLSSGSTTALTYTYSSGTGTTNIPGNIKIALFICAIWGGTNSRSLVRDSSDNFDYATWNASGTDGIARIYAQASKGIKLRNSGGNTFAGDINLGGFIDSVLGVGSNPLL